MTEASEGQGRPPTMSETTTEIFSALVKAQANFSNPKKDKNVTVKGFNEKTKKAYSYDFKYADLASCFDAVRKPLADQGLAVIQPLRREGQMLVLVTILIHTSGEWISTDIPLGGWNISPQDLGGKITYLRRYELSTLLGIATEDDDQAEQSVARSSERPHNRPAGNAGGGRSAAAGGVGGGAGPQITPPKEAYAGRWQYRLETGILTQDSAGNIVEVDATDFSKKELGDRLELLVKRGKIYSESKNEDKRLDAEREWKVVRKILDTIAKLEEETGETEESLEEDQKEAAADDPPAQDGKSEPPADENTSDQAEPSESTPEPQTETAGEPKKDKAPDSFEAVVDNPATLDLEIGSGISYSSPIGDLEVLDLAGLTRPEIVSLALAKANEALFVTKIPADVLENHQGVKLYTPAWIVGPWLEAHEADKERLKLARKLLRIAIRHWDLAGRRHGMGGDLDAKERAGKLAGEKRLVNEGEAIHVEFLEDLYSTKAGA